MVGWVAATAWKRRDGDRILRKCGGLLWGCGAVEAQSLDGLPPFLGVGGVGGTTTILDRGQHRLAVRCLCRQEVGNCHRELSLAGSVDSSATGPREGCTVTGLAGLNGRGRCKQTACGTRLNSWQWSSAVLRCRGGPVYHKRRNVVRNWLRCLRREEAEGRRLPEMGLPLVKYDRGHGQLGGSLGCLPCRLHWYLPKKVAGVTAKRLQPWPRMLYSLKATLVEPPKLKQFKSSGLEKSFVEDVFQDYKIALIPLLQCYRKKGLSAATYDKGEAILLVHKMLQRCFNWKINCHESNLCKELGLHTYFI